MRQRAQPRSPAGLGVAQRLLATRRPSVVLHVMYLASGLVALLYEVVWTRLLTLDFGHTVASASTVLAAFMGGLAAGAVLAGSRVSGLSPRRALRTYAILELSLAACALLLPWVMAGVRPLLAAAYADGTGPWFGAIRVMLALMLVGVPATIMGATYPMMLRAAGDPKGGAAASLYAVNTLGAAAGALVTGFVLLPALGMLMTTALGAAINLALFFAARRASSALQDVVVLPDVSAAPRKKRVGASARLLLPLPLTVSIVALSGASALALEVTWTRVLALIVGPTTYAFTAMLVAFILGLAGGAALGTWLGSRIRTPELWMAGALAGGALATVMSSTQIERALLLVARSAADPGATLGSMVALQCAVAIVHLSPLALCFGMVFPLALRTVESSEWRAAFLYAGNSAGAILGSLGAGFVLIPVLGLQGTLNAAVIVLALSGVALAVRHASRRPTATAVPIVLAAAALLATRGAGWDPRLLSSGAYKYAPYLAADDLEALLQAGRLTYYREGAAATVAVRDVAGVRSLSIDGKVDASNGSDMLTQRLLAHLPLLLHGQARKVAIVGLGSGVTLGSALTHAVERVDVIEISPEVVEAARLFERENGRALEDGRARLIIGDARTHFLRRVPRYDVVISEPSNPWMAGVAALFTREFFASLRESVVEGGLVCQWTHVYDLSVADLKSIVATFASVFPHTTMWLIGEGDLLMVGADRPIGPRMASVSSGFARKRVADDLAAVGVTGPGVLASLLLGGDDLARRWSEGATLQRDDRMSLEFSAPAETLGRTRSDNAAILRAAAGAARPPEAAALIAVGNGGGVRDAALMLLKADASEAAWSMLLAHPALLADDREAVKAFTRAALVTRHVADAERLLVDLIARRPEATGVRLEYSRLLAASGQLEAAAAAVREAERLDPSAMEVVSQVAAVAADAGDIVTLRRAVGRLRSLAPASADAAYYAGTLAVLEGRAEQAVRDASRATLLWPADARTWNLLGVALGAAGAAPMEVRGAFSKAVEADPADPAGYVNLGTLMLQVGEPSEAAAWFAEGLTIDPSNVRAREGYRSATHH